MAERRHKLLQKLCRCVNSNKSRNVIKEISIAVKDDIVVIPLKIDSAPYSDTIAYDLTILDFIDFEKEKNPFQKMYIAIKSYL